MSERRSLTAPPEMMNGSTSGRARSNSSMRAMRITGDIQEVQLPVEALELPPSLELQHSRDQAVPRVEYQRVQRALRARPVGRGELRERQLEEGVELHAFATALRVFEQHAAGADVAGGHTRTVGGGSGRSQAVEVQDAEVAVSQVPAAVRDPRLVVAQATATDHGGAGP